MIDMPPGKYFISHSYGDADKRDAMINQLPNGVTPYIFPPIDVTPMEFVSNSLINAILSCDGMIYMNEGESNHSFWVAFERDYAIRSNKIVFSYTPSKNIFSHHTTQALDLVIFASYARRDLQTVMPILEFMREHRYFDIWLDKEQIKDGELWKNKIEQGINNTIKRGGYVATFWGTNISEWLMNETIIGLKKQRVIVAGLGNTSPDFIQDYPDMFIQLMELEQINNNCIDDFIVRLYWLIFRNQFPELVFN